MGVVAAGYGLATVFANAIIYGVVGAIVAGVMGGDARQGFLYGAIGGAVSAGLGEFASLGGTTTSSSSEVYAAQQADVAGLRAAEANASATSTSGTSGSSTWYSDFKEGLAGGVKNAISSGGGSGGILDTVAEGALQIGGNALAARDAAEEAEKARKAASEENQKQLDAQLEAAELNSATSIYGYNKSYEAKLAEIAEGKRQFNVTREDALAERKQAAETLSQLDAARKSYVLAATKSVDEASSEQTTPFYKLKYNTGSGTTEEETT